MVTALMAPGPACMPQARDAPSNAGPVAQEVAESRSSPLKNEFTVGAQVHGNPESILAFGRSEPAFEGFWKDNGGLGHDMGGKHGG